MAFSDISSKTTFSGNFSVGDEQKILSAMERVYNGSGIARAMFDVWELPINIAFRSGKFEALTSLGLLNIDLSNLDNLGYIDYQGKAKPYTLDQALAHEFVHALVGLKDDGDYIIDYRGKTVDYANLIWQELNYSPMLSILSMGSLDRQGVNYSYTNLLPIDSAVRVEAPDRESPNWSSPLSIDSRDLLLGGEGNNILDAGGGNDFLFGGEANDTLKGGAGKDTAVYFGSEKDYDIRQNFVTNPNPLRRV